MKPHKIGWLNIPGYIPQTWNPIIGCSKVSDGCRNCYAERMAIRLVGMGVSAYGSVIGPTCDYEDGRWNGKTKLVESALQTPLGWKKPRAIFVNSMGDLFHENTPDEWIDRVFAVMALCPQHLFIVLTKRAEQMAQYFSRSTREAIRIEHATTFADGYFISYQFPLKNVWLGVTAENQAAADERIPHLLSTPAAVRFVSCEPLIGSVLFDDDEIARTCSKCGSGDFGPCKNDVAQCWGYSQDEEGELCGCKTSTGIDWIICGGESGPGARPMNPEWARSLRDQAQSASVPFFFKQWGRFHGGYRELPLTHSDVLDGQKHHQWPEVTK